MDTRSGLAASVSLISSSSVRMLLVVAAAPSMSAQPVARFSLPVKSIPTIRGNFPSPEHFFRRPGTKSVERSEERRVGKECRSGESRRLVKKNNKEQTYD